MQRGTPELTNLQVLNAILYVAEHGCKDAAEHHSADDLKWRKRFLEQRIDGLIQDRHSGQKPSVIMPRLQAEVLAATRRKPSGGSTHLPEAGEGIRYQQRRGASYLAHRRSAASPVRALTASNDPDFRAQAAEIIGLYLNPSQHAAVFCADKKSAIQAWTVWIPFCRCLRAEPNAMGLSINRHGTLSRYPALDVKTGKVQGKTAARHSSDEFVAFL